MSNDAIPASTIPSIVDDAEPLQRAINGNPAAQLVRPDGTVHYLAFWSATEPWWHISVDRGLYRSKQATLRGRAGFRLGVLNTGAVRRLELSPPAEVTHKPEPEDESDPSSPINHAHAHISVPPKGSAPDSPPGYSKNKVKTVVCAKLAELTIIE